MARPFPFARVHAVAVLPLFLCASCATAGTGADTDADTDAGDASSRMTGASTQVIRGEEILAGTSSNAWEAIRDHVHFVFFREDARGNPQMATRRGNTSILGPQDVRILLDQSRIYDLRDLLLVPAENIREIRVLSAVDATTYFGTNSGSGAVLIVTR